MDAQWTNNGRSTCLGVRITAYIQAFQKMLKKGLNDTETREVANTSRRDYHASSCMKAKDHMIMETLYDGNKK